MAKTASAPAPSLLTPGNQALSVAVNSANSGTTANTQTGQIFQNATTGPYTKANADAISSGGQATVNPSTIVPSTAQNFTPNSLGSFIQSNNGNTQAGRQAFQGFRKANIVPQAILPISQRTNITPSVGTGGNMGAVKPLGGMTGAPNTQITPIAPANFGQSSNQITSTLGTTPQDSDFLKKSFSQFTPAQQAEWNAMSQQNKLESSKTLLQGYRDTRDASLNKENMDYNHDLTVNAKTAQFQADMATAQRNIATTNQNMALVTGMSGPLRSSDVASATSNAIANSQSVYNNLVRSNDYEMAQLSHNYQMASKSLLNTYNDRVSTTTQKLLSNISASDATGALGTKLGLLKAQDFIDQALNDHLNSQQFLADRMNMMSKIALEQQTQALELGKLDKDISAGINDGFAYNVQGNRMKNANGQPIQYKMSMSDIEKLQAQNNFATKLAGAQNDFAIKLAGVNNQADLDQLKEKYRIAGYNTNSSSGSSAGSPSNLSPSSGRIVPVSVGGKTVYLDENASSGFASAINSAETAGAPIFFSKGARDQAQTIQEMASDPKRGGMFGISFNASNPNETASQLRAKGFQVADVGKSNHESGMAIDVYSDSSMKSGPTPAQEQILNANGWYSGNIPGDAGHFEYKGKGTQGYTTEQQIFDAIFQGSGGASKVSEGEGKIIKDRAKEFASQGLTPQDALLKYKGLNVKPENSDKALEYINIGDNLVKKPSNYEMTVAKYLNNGDKAGLDTYVNRLVDQDVSALYKTDAILSGDFKTGSDRTNKLIGLLENNKDKIGAFDGRVNDLIQKFSGTPEYQNIKTLLQMSQADMRKYFAGSAVTETEMKALQDFIGGTTKMNADNLITMLSTLNNDRQSTYNNQRAGMVSGFSPTTPSTPGGETSASSGQTNNPPVDRARIDRIKALMNQ